MRRHEAFNHWHSQLGGRANRTIPSLAGQSLGVGDKVKMNGCGKFDGQSDGLFIGK